MAFDGGSVVQRLALADNGGVSDERVVHGRVVLDNNAIDDIAQQHRGGSSKWHTYTKVYLWATHRYRVASCLKRCTTRIGLPT